MQSESLEISANVVDVLNRRIFPGRIGVSGGKIVSVNELSQPQPTYLLPGFVDAHVHVESSMLVPSEFARAAVLHGTVATVSDPHEIGNVLGIDGVRFMMKNAQQVPFKFFLAPRHASPPHGTRRQGSGSRWTRWPNCWTIPESCT